MNTQSPAAILFDLDDTLAATVPIWRAAELHLLHILGHQLTPDLALLFKGLSAPDLVTAIHNYYHPALPLDDCQKIMRDALLQNFSQLPITPKPGALNCVRRARAVAPLALASGSPLSAIELTLTKLALSDQFQILCSSEEVPRGKPHPDVFLESARRLHVPPTRCLVLEDSLAGAQAARAAGMACFVVPSCQPEEIRPLATRTFNSLEDIHESDFRSALANHQPPTTNN